MLNRKIKLRTKIQKNFIVSPKYYGKNIIVFIPSQGFYYNHDEMFDIIDTRGNNKKSLFSRGYYTKTGGFPKFVEDRVYSL